jgi:hypothetical protein
VHAVPGREIIRIFADSRYALSVNGELIGRGPVRSQPRRAKYDEYDIAGHLFVGPNLIEVVVTYYGTANSFWQPAHPNSTLGGRPVLVVDEPGELLGIATDETWFVCEQHGVSAAPAEGFHGIPAEVIDARVVSDEEWQQACIVAAAHFGALARSTPPTDPYGALGRRPIGMLGGEVRAPQACQTISNVQCETKSHPSETLNGGLQGAGCAFYKTTTVPCSLKADGSEILELDFGGVVCGRLTVEFESDRGITVDLLYAERRPNPEVKQSISPVTGARYVARGRDDVFRAEEANGFRYVYLTAVGAGEGRIVVKSLTVEESLYPYRGDSGFRTSDKQLVSLYDAGRRTVSLNSRDAFTDCPTREQRAWVSDGVIHQMVHLTTSTDWRLANWYVELGNSPRYDGMLPRSVVGDMEYNETTAIPDWALTWIHGVWNLFRYEGDKGLLRAYMPTVARIIRWFLPFRNDVGLLSSVPEWNLVDWSAVFVNGVSSLVNGLWGRALREYSEMSRYLGNMGESEWADALYESLRDGFEEFWDPIRGTYKDQASGVPGEAPASQLAGACAIVSGLAPKSRWDSIAEWIGDENRLVVRSWIGRNGGYDDDLISAHLEGVQEVTWNAAREVVRAEPYGSYLVHDAFALAGRFDLLRANLSRWTEFLDDGYDTFGECWGWGTPAHGWSSTPTRDIVQYLVGVTPAAPGFGSARIRPASGVIGDFIAKVPCRNGLIALELSKGCLRVESPIPFTLEFGDISGEYGAGSYDFC